MPDSTTQPGSDVKGKRWAKSQRQSERKRLAFAGVKYLYDRFVKGRSEEEAAYREHLDKVGYYGSMGQCELCKGPLQPYAKYGVCTRTDRCFKEKRRRAAQWWKEHDPGRRIRSSRRSQIRRTLRRKLAKIEAGEVVYSGRATGRDHHLWTGGRFSFCCGCGSALGWKSPQAIANYRDGVPCCRSCSNLRPRYKTRVYRRNRISCVCSKCGIDLKPRPPSQVRNRMYCSGCWGRGRKLKESQNGTHTSRLAKAV